MPESVSKLLVLGHAPLPFEPRKLQFSGNLRTWHFVKPLLDAGHEVRLVAARIPGSYGDDEVPAEVLKGNLRYLSVEMDVFNDLNFLQQQHDALLPDAIIGVNTHPSWKAVQIDTQCPIWCDNNGWAMAEAQTKAATYAEDRYLSHFWNMERSILDRADVISTVSKAQAQATVGELAGRGRLSRRTLGYEFCRHIPNAVVDPEVTPKADVLHDSRLRGSRLPDDAFILLWAGGYNTWADIDTLFEALSLAMAQIDDLHFVSTGGALAGHDDLTFERFRRRVDAASFAERTHFVGWVPTDQVPSYYLDADLGLNVDKPSYETTFGARNRINDMLALGLPVLTTLGTEISHQLTQQNWVLSSEVGQATAFAEQICWAAAHRDTLGDLGREASAGVRRVYSYAATTHCLVDWAAAPQRAPDAAERIELDDSVDFFTMPLPGNESPPAESPSAQPPSPEPPDVTLEARFDAQAEELAEIKGSKMWRLWMHYQRFRRWFSR